MSKTLVNIGTAERPCFVSEDALFSPQSASGNSWWGKVATGSVTISQRNLGRALKISGQNGEPKNGK